MFVILGQLDRLILLYPNLDELKDAIWAKKPHLAYYLGRRTRGVVRFGTC
jgi:hypothetical protein